MLFFFLVERLKTCLRESDLYFVCFSVDYKTPQLHSSCPWVLCSRLLPPLHLCVHVCAARMACLCMCMLSREKCFGASLPVGTSFGTPAVAVIRVCGAWQRNFVFAGCAWMIFSDTRSGLEDFRLRHQCVCRDRCRYFSCCCCCCCWKTRAPCSLLYSVLSKNCDANTITSPAFVCNSTEGARSSSFFLSPAACPP